MNSARKIGLWVLGTALIATGGCSKEPAPPPPPKEVTGSSVTPSTTAGTPVAQTAVPVAIASPGASGIDAKAAEELAKKSGCLACHAVDRKVVGPAYNDVAAKYRGQADAEVKLIEKVKKGGQGVWGQVPMPPNSPQVKDADIKTLVQWILGLK